MLARRHLEIDFACAELANVVLDRFDNEIHYYRHSWGGSAFDGDYPYSDASHDERPLIEMPVAIRLKTVEPPSRLVNAIASRIPERMVLPRQLTLLN